GMLNMFYWIEVNIYNLTVCWIKSLNREGKDLSDLLEIVAVERDDLDIPASRAPVKTHSEMIAGGLSVALLYILRHNKYGVKYTDARIIAGTPEAMERFSLHFMVEEIMSC